MTTIDLRARRTTRQSYKVVRGIFSGYSSYYVINKIYTGEFDSLRAAIGAAIREELL